YYAAQDSTADEARPGSRERAHPGSGAEQPHFLHTRGPLSQALESYPGKSAVDPQTRSWYEHLAMHRYHVRPPTPLVPSRKSWSRLKDSSEATVFSTSKIYWRPNGTTTRMAISEPHLGMGGRVGQQSLFRLQAGNGRHPGVPVTHPLISFAAPHRHFD